MKILFDVLMLGCIYHHIKPTSKPYQTIRDKALSKHFRDASKECTIHEQNNSKVPDRIRRLKTHSVVISLTSNIFHRDNVF